MENLNELTQNVEVAEVALEQTAVEPKGVSFGKKALVVAGIVTGVVVAKKVFKWGKGKYTEHKLKKAAAANKEATVVTDSEE